MSTSLSKVLTGTILGCSSLFVFCMNVCVLAVLVRGGFLKKHHNSVYILTFTNIVGDTLQMAIVAFYLSPSSIMQSWLFPGGLESPFSKALGITFQMQWYQCVITEVIMALDRLVVVVYPQWDFLFSRRNVIIISACIFPVALILALIADLVFPCCTVYVYHGVFGYSYFGEGTNYANQIFDVPMNFSSSAIALTCYAVIFVYVRRSNRVAVGTLDQQSAIRRKKKEVRYALQFGLLSLFVLCAWMSFRIFPLVVPPEVPELYVLITMCVVVHCSSNSFIYLTMNSEFKKQFAAQFTGRRMATTTASTSFGSGAKGPQSSGPNNSHATPNDA